MILSAANAISAQQAIALALPAAITVVSGLLFLIVPDARAAWRRGFRQGCETTLTVRTGDFGSDVTMEPCRDHSQRSG